MSEEAVLAERREQVPGMGVGGGAELVAEEVDPCARMGQPGEVRDERVVLRGDGVRESVTRSTPR